MDTKKNAGVKTRLAAIGAAAALAVTTLAVPGAVADPPQPHPDQPGVGKALLPKPNSAVFDHAAQGFTFKPDACVSVPSPAYEDAVAVLRRSVATSYGLKLPLGADCAVRIVEDASLRDNRDPGDEAYNLTATGQGVTITAASPRAGIWGMQTLKQLMGPWANAPTRLAGDAVVPAVTIKDAPRYEWRGLMIDPVRSFIPVDEVKNLIDMMSEVKFNVLHIHLNDDQGWRLEIEPPATPDPDGVDYSLLTERSGKTAIVGTNYNSDPGRAGFYTKQQFIDLVAYAAHRGISVLPEIDGPGHANGMLHAIPQLNTEKANPKPEPGEDTVKPFDESLWNQTSLDATSPVTLRMMKHVYNTIEGYVRQGLAKAGRPGYKLPYFHVGGDESGGTQHPDYRYYMKELGKQFDPAQPTRPIVWNEAIDPARGAPDLLPAGTMVQQWTGVPPNKNNKISNFVRDKNAKVLMSQAARTYFPQRPAPDLDGPEWACRDTHGCLTGQFYNWDPTQLAGVAEANVKGVEAPLWNEHVRDEHGMLYQMFPRAFATAEVGWTKQNLRSYDDFKARMSPLGVNMINRDGSFHLAPELSKWQGQAHGVPVERAAQPAEQLIGLIAMPGLKQPNLAALDQQATFVDSAGKEFTVTPRYEMARDFNYQDTTPPPQNKPNQQSTKMRRMNSLVKVYATIPAEAAEGAGQFKGGTLRAWEFPPPSAELLSNTPGLTTERVTPLAVTFAVPVSGPQPPDPGAGEGDGTNPGGDGDSGGTDAGTQTDPEKTDTATQTDPEKTDAGTQTDPADSGVGVKPDRPVIDPGTLLPVVPSVSDGSGADPGSGGAGEGGTEGKGQQGKGEQSGKGDHHIGVSGKSGEDGKRQGGTQGGSAGSGSEVAVSSSGQASLARTGSDAVTGVGVLAGLALLGLGLSLARRRTN